MDGNHDASEAQRDVESALAAGQAGVQGSRREAGGYCGSDDAESGGDRRDRGESRAVSGWLLPSGTLWCIARLSVCPNQDRCGPIRGLDGSKGGPTEVVDPKPHANIRSSIAVGVWMGAGGKGKCWDVCVAFSVCNAQPCG